jgi:hypothetical protein
MFSKKQKGENWHKPGKSSIFTLLLFLIPILLFSTNIANFFERVEDENIVFATGLESANSQKSSGILKTF